MATVRSSSTSFPASPPTLSGPAAAVATALAAMQVALSPTAVGSPANATIAARLTVATTGQSTDAALSIGILPVSSTSPEVPHLPILGVRLTDSLGGLLVTTALVHAALAASGGRSTAAMCISLFDEATVAAFGGAGAACMRTTLPAAEVPATSVDTLAVAREQITVQFGADATVTAGSAIVMRPYDGRLAISSDSTDTVIYTVTRGPVAVVAAPASPIALAAVIEGPAVVTACAAQVTIDGRSSAARGTGGRALSYEWAVTRVGGDGTNVLEGHETTKSVDGR